jgi:hypothetical protein
MLYIRSPDALGRAYANFREWDFSDRTSTVLDRARRACPGFLAKFKGALLRALAH